MRCCASNVSLLAPPKRQDPTLRQPHVPLAYIQVRIATDGYLRNEQKPRPSLRKCHRDKTTWHGRQFRPVSAPR